MSDERRRVRAAFDAAASRYDGSAQVQREIAAALAGRIEGQPGTPGLALDAGCGTGYGLAHLGRLRPAMDRLGLDLAPAMARASAVGGARTLAGDIEALPIADATVSLYWSSLAWQWCDAKRAAREALRVLRPGGELFVATLGPDTLSEVREAFAVIDSAPHVRAFAPADALSAALAEAGFDGIEFRGETHFAWADDLATLLRAIRAIGADTLGERRQGLLSRSAWRAIAERYETHRCPQGLPARYDVQLIRARKMP